MERLNRQTGMRRTVRIYRDQSGCMPTPAVTGLFHPGIWLPKIMADTWSPEELEPVLLHELAHIKRHDLIINWLQMVIQAVYFFHPFTWIANSRIHRTREDICDDMAILFLRSDHKRYSQSMLRAGEEMMVRKQQLFAEVGFSERRSRLGERVRRIMNRKYAPSRRMNAAAIITLCAVAAFGFAMTCISSADRPMSETKLIAESEINSADTSGKAAAAMYSAQESAEIKALSAEKKNQESYQKQAELQAKLDAYTSPDGKMLPADENIYDSYRKQKELQAKLETVSAEEKMLSNEMKEQEKKLKELQKQLRASGSANEKMLSTELRDQEKKVKELQLKLDVYEKMRSREQEKKLQELQNKLEIHQSKAAGEHDSQAGQAVNTKTKSLPVVVRIGDGTGIVEGTDQLKLGGKTLVRDTDYRINYQTGEITLLNKEILDPTADLQVSYQSSVKNGKK
jgi:hypothetical protein